MEHGRGPAWAEAIEASWIGEAMRGGVLLYPFVETAHILGFAVLVGSILVLDLRLLGLGGRIGVKTLSGLVVPVAGVGLAVAMSMGFLLFATEAGAYVGNPLFLAKMAILLVALANIVVHHRRIAWRLADGEPVPDAARLSGLVSLLAWGGVVICGRLIAYV